jgi:hypothetical protein
MSETQAYQIIDHSYDDDDVGAGGSLRQQRGPQSTTLWNSGSV